MGWFDTVKDWTGKATGWTANELLGIDDFRRVGQKLGQGDFFGAAKSLGAGAVELGSTFVPAGKVLKAGSVANRVARPVYQAARLADTAGGLTRSGRAVTQGLRYGGEIIPNTNFAGQLLGGFVAPSRAAAAAPVQQQRGPGFAGLLSSAVQNAASGFGARPAAPSHSSYLPQPKPKKPKKPKAPKPGGGGTVPGSNRPMPPSRPTRTTIDEEKELWAENERKRALAQAQLPALSPEEAAMFGSQRTGAESEFQSLMSALAAERAGRSMEAQEALRGIGRQEAGAMADFQSMAGETGLGLSPAIAGVARQEMAQRAAAQRRGVGSSWAQTLAGLGQQQMAGELGRRRRLEDIRRQEAAVRAARSQQNIANLFGGLS